MPAESKARRRTRKRALPPAEGCTRCGAGEELSSDGLCPTCVVEVKSTMLTPGIYESEQCLLINLRRLATVLKMEPEKFAGYVADLAGGITTVTEMSALLAKAGIADHVKEMLPGLVMQLAPELLPTVLSQLARRDD